MTNVLKPAPVTVPSSHRKRTKHKRPGGKKGRPQFSPVRTFIEEWIHLLPQYLFWKYNPFNIKGGRTYSALLKEYIWARLSDAEKIDACGLNKAITNTPPFKWNTHFSDKVQNITRSGRESLIVMPRSNGAGAHRQKGDKNGHHIDNIMASRSDWNQEQLDAHRKRQHKYRLSDKGKVQMTAYLQKSAAIVFASRATQVYRQVGSECISDEVDAILRDTWDDL